MIGAEPGRVRRPGYYDLRARSVHGLNISPRQLKAGSNVFERLWLWNQTCASKLYSTRPVAI